MKYDKPFKTYDELIELMISRNIEISDRQFAKKVLSNISYYTLVNGYKNTFLSANGDNMFTPGTRFEELYTIHIIDSNFSSILLKYILYIERSLKSKISYIIAQNYGVYTDFSVPVSSDLSDYLCLYNYGSSTGHRRNVLKRIKECVKSTKGALSLDHYLQNKNHVPPWILIKNVSFGLSIKWYGILKDSDKSYVCENFMPSAMLALQGKKEFLIKALNILKDYRNNMAHGHRTFENITNNELPKKPLLSLASLLITESEYISNLGRSDPYSVVIAISVLLNDPYLMNNFVRDLILLFQDYIKSNILFCEKTVLEVFGMPGDIFDRMSIFSHHRYKEELEHKEKRS